ncbi:hypothetical protein ACI79C_11535 [Geodermatophilus sp. SYSU D00697]
MRRPTFLRAPAVDDLRRDDVRRRETPAPTAVPHDPTPDPVRAATPAPRPVAPAPAPPPAEQHPAPGRPAHWAPPDPLGDILAVAWRPGAAPPREIHVRPEVRDRILAQLPPADRALTQARGTVGGPVPVPLVVDAELPAFPGFEVVRTRPDRLAAA